MAQMYQGIGEGSYGNYEFFMPSPDFVNVCYRDVTINRVKYDSIRIQLYRHSDGEWRPHKEKQHDWFHHTYTRRTDNKEASIDARERICKTVTADWNTYVSNNTEEIGKHRLEAAKYKANERIEKAKDEIERLKNELAEALVELNAAEAAREVLEVYDVLPPAV